MFSRVLARNFRAVIQRSSQSLNHRCRESSTMMVVNSSHLVRPRPLFSPPVSHPAPRAIYPPLRGQGDSDRLIAERCKNWHTTEVPLPFGWSTDWKRWKTIDQFLVEPGWYDLCLVDVMFKHYYKIEGAMLPLAFLDCHLFFMFFAGGKHYYFDDILGLFEYLDNFPTHDDFLRRHLGARYRIHPVPDGWEEAYVRVDTEQCALMRDSKNVKIDDERK
ncbi:hypothetical protein C8R44DRAFT_990369, partial [Mycena epipterygia]